MSWEIRKHLELSPGQSLRTCGPGFFSVLVLSHWSPLRGGLLLTNPAPGLGSPSAPTLTVILSISGLWIFIEEITRDPLSPGLGPSHSS